MKLLVAENCYLQTNEFHEQYKNRVGFFIKDTLNFKIVRNYNLNLNGCEKIWVKIDINGTEKVFAVTYRHPHPQIKDFLMCFESSIAMLIEHKVDYYICGDINIDLLQSEMLMLKIMQTQYSA